ncbi:MAG: signal peptide peptidase SppA [Spirochaetaceae bacterium]|nr:signal peptide peptidase SppA [Spirochaetaceae bacterium]
MRKTILTPPIAAVALVLALAARPLAFAQASYASDAPRFRADDASAWRAWDNPALWGFSDDLLCVGARFVPVETTEASVSADLAIVTPLAAYGARVRGSRTVYRAASYFGVLPSLTLGYQSVFDSENLTSGADFGIAFRPWDLVSLGAVYQDAYGSAPSLGLGMGLRPLALFRGDGSVLTLTADALIVPDGFQLETAGARLSLGGVLGLRVWWDVPRETPGAELTVSLGAATVAASSKSLGDSALEELDLAGSLSLRRDGQGVELAVGKRVLVLKDLDAISAAPSSGPRFAEFLSGTKTMDLRELCDTIRRAAKDRGVVAVALEDLPPVGAQGAAQELASAIDELRAKGKKLYVHGENFTSSAFYQIALARADKVSLDPNGMLYVAGYGGSKLYFKTLLDKIGLDFQNLAPWDTKSANNPLTMDSMPPAERAMLERYLGDLQAQETEALEKGRKGALASPATELVDRGPYLVAALAREAGLVDALERRPEFEDALRDAHPGASLSYSLPEPRDAAWGPSPLAKRIAVVWLVGGIEQGEGSPGTSIGRSAAREIKGLREDRSVAGIVLRVDSGGGSALTSDGIAAEVKATVAAGKPVAVSMGDYAASGGYYVAAYASRIFADPGTLTGSIGVTGLQPNFARLIEKLGIKAESLGSTRSGAFADPFQAPRAEDAEAFRAYVMSIYDRFVSVVSEGRKMTAERVRELGEGQVWTGREALANGLVDELGGLDAAQIWIEAETAGIGGPRAEFFDVLPGERLLFGGPSIVAARDLAVRIGAAVARAFPAPAAPGAELVTSLQSLAGPAARDLASLLRMGDGALLLCPEALGRGP